MAAPTVTLAESYCAPSVEVEAYGADNQGSPASSFSSYRQDGESVGASVKLKIPLGNDNCKAKAARDNAKARYDRAFALRYETDQLEKLLRLCKEYGNDNPLLRGKCQ